MSSAAAIVEVTIQIHQAEELNITFTDQTEGGPSPAERLLFMLMGKCSGLEVPLVIAPGLKFDSSLVSSENRWCLNTRRMARVNENVFM